jgi:plastocyanin
VKRSLVTVLMTALLCAGAIGCGGDNNDNGSGDTATTGGTTTGGEETTTGETTTGGEAGGKKSAKSTVKVDEVDIALQPANPKVKVGTVTFRIKNKGTLLHGVEVEGPGGEKRSTDILPGKSATLRVNFNKPGKYEWYCPIDEHKKLGMKGKITVTGGA